MAPRRGCEPPHPTAASSRRPGPRAAAGDTETHVFSRRRRTSPRGGSIYPTPSTARSRVPRPEREPIRAVEARSQAPRPAPRTLAHIGSALLLPRAAAARLLALRVGPRCGTQTPRSAASCRPPPQLLQPGSRGSAGPGPTPHSFHSSRSGTFALEGTWAGHRATRRCEGEAGRPPGGAPPLNVSYRPRRGKMCDFLGQLRP
ncbi:translation initiation factor IF-2-like [Canis lupus familiaris]|uniref:translation initiation factor IF-2-like n=1 Tax=Canis lupus familiaris TaxID=9615 RepID=UPI000BAA03DA|nr:translation initiation factor IF-2-like [Canis lupus familiaris]|eukprot:XP_022275972.1 uncharacterized protein LOC111096329 isoform X1 [Canis lupus familiaris]